MSDYFLKTESQADKDKNIYILCGLLVTHIWFLTIDKNTQAYHELNIFASIGTHYCRYYGSSMNLQLLHQELLLYLVMGYGFCEPNPNSPSDIAHY